MREKEGEVFTSYEGDIDVLREEIDEMKRALLNSEDTIERLKKEVDRARAHREGVDINKVVHEELKKSEAETEGLKRENSELKKQLEGWKNSCLHLIEVNKDLTAASVRKFGADSPGKGRGKGNQVSGYLFRMKC